MGVVCNWQERVGTVEKQKSELMMQAALMQQAGPSHMVQMPAHYAAGNTGIS